MMIDFTKFLTDTQEAPKPKRESRYKQLENAIEESSLSREHKELTKDYIPVLLSSTRMSYKGFSTMLTEFTRVVPEHLRTQRILTATNNGYRNLVFSSDYDSIDTISLNKKKKEEPKKEMRLSDEVF